ncbi:hypothetical protein CRG98_030122 [Punica granatum]|uniref:Uncharacterized protein n=1 Tax=Punica granatum TaxID=22663 RepID=A0A2I0IZV2_PUNGR|nr:hypothetical protein CRG98_030122 [Punica granatum]
MGLLTGPPHPRLEISRVRFDENSRLWRALSGVGVAGGGAPHPNNIERKRKEERDGSSFCRSMVY